MKEIRRRPPAEQMFDAAFQKLRKIFTSKTKQAFLDDIKGQIEDDEGIQEILRKPFSKARYYAVTFDRRKNDNNFSYSYFDQVLVALDAISGGRAFTNRPTRCAPFSGTGPSPIFCECSNISRGTTCK
jgi:hypothetical protein